MTRKTDMYYRFTSDEEPTDEQLEALMEDAIEEVRKKNANKQALISENIYREYQNVKKMFPNL
ncbi:MAG: hypothetical protein FWH18_00745 [Marinilabiliaceae bacterium]|nr:hypothetical protein [Marinilabiliaceae bacterium]